MKNLFYFLVKFTVYYDPQLVKLLKVGSWTTFVLMQLCSLCFWIIVNVNTGSMELATWVFALMNVPTFVMFSILQKWAR